MSEELAKQGGGIKIKTIEKREEKRELYEQILREVATNAFMLLRETTGVFREGEGGDKEEQKERN